MSYQQSSRKAVQSSADFRGEGSHTVNKIGMQGRLVVKLQFEDAKAKRK
jgi:hypothetical protein